MLILQPNKTKSFTFETMYLQNNCDFSLGLNCSMYLPPGEKRYVKPACSIIHFSCGVERVVSISLTFGVKRPRITHCDPNFNIVISLAENGEDWNISVCEDQRHEENITFSSIWNSGPCGNDSDDNFSDDDFSDDDLMYEDIRIVNNTIIF